jgi:hypothetical protein
MDIHEALERQCKRRGEGVNVMTEKKETAPKEQRKKKKEAAEPLPSCTTAPSAEHARAHDEDEPCDDARGQE